MMGDGGASVTAASPTVATEACETSTVSFTALEEEEEEDETALAVAAAAAAVGVEVDGDGGDGGGGGVGAAGVAAAFSAAAAASLAWCSFVSRIAFSTIVSSFGWEAGVGAGVGVGWGWGWACGGCAAALGAVKNLGLNLPA